MWRVLEKQEGDIEGGHFGHGSQAVGNSSHLFYKLYDLGSVNLLSFRYIIYKKWEKVNTYFTGLF